MHNHTESLFYYKSVINQEVLELKFTSLALMTDPRFIQFQWIHVNEVKYECLDDIHVLFYCDICKNMKMYCGTLDYLELQLCFCMHSYAFKTWTGL